MNKLIIAGIIIIGIIFFIWLIISARKEAERLKSGG